MDHPTPPERPLGDTPAFPLSPLPKTAATSVATYRKLPMFAIPIGMFGLVVAILPPLLVTLALRMRELDPENAAGSLSLVLGVGALFALIAGPIAGRLSDRTTSRLGMRKPWILGGAAAMYAGIVVIAFAPNVAVVLIGWCFTQIAFNFAMAPLIAMLPDQVRPSQRGRVASFLSLGQNIAAVAGTFLVQLFPIGLAQTLVPSLVGLVLLLVMVLPVKDRVRAERPDTPFNLRELFGSFVFNPRKHPDFGWAWLTRLFLVATQTTATSYLAFFLIVNLGVPDEDAPALVFQATLANAAGIFVTTALLGWISDKVGRRKPFVIGAALTAGVGLTIIAFAPSFEVVLIGQAILGAGMGSFLAVELALISEVLPSEDDAGKDLGVVNIAQVLPQSLVPVAAPGIVALFGYPGLFLGGALMGILGAFTVTRVKKVR